MAKKKPKTRLLIDSNSLRNSIRSGVMANGKTLNESDTSIDIKYKRITNIVQEVFNLYLNTVKVRRRANIRNRYNQALHGS